MRREIAVVLHGAPAENIVTRVAQRANAQGLVPLPQVQ